MKVRDLFSIISNYDNIPHFVFFTNIAEMIEATSTERDLSDYFQMSFGNTISHVDPECIFTNTFLNNDVLEIRAIGLDNYAVAVRDPIGGDIE